MKETRLQELPLLLALLAFALVPAVAAGPPAVAARGTGSTASKVRIAAFFRNTPTGERHLQGVLAAVEAHPIGERVEVTPVPYVDEREGDSLLSALVRGEYELEPGRPVSFDLILGPTDSGVFLRGKSRQEELAEFRVPVISSLVTAKEDNRTDDWFLRTNVDVVRRSAAIYDHLNKRWVNSITIVYANSEFGRLAEEAFRANLSGLQEELYEAFPFESGLMRSQMRSVLRRRPEAVGIFGEREDIVTGYESLLAQNDSIVPYEPLLFTVLDIRSLHADVDDFLYVSVIQPQSEAALPAEEQPDNVYGLSYDTTSMVLDVIRGVGARWDPEVFRTSFTANVLGGRKGARGDRTGMRFTGRQNAAEVFVYELSDDQVLYRPAVDVGLIEKLEHKVTLIFRRFGLMPVVVLLAMLLTVLATSLHDFQLWYGGHSRRVLRSRHFLGVVLLQGGLACILFVTLCELGKASYDGLVAGVLVALAPSPILRTTLLRVGGRSIGVAGVYDRLLKRMTRRFITARYADPEVNAVFLAYFNSYEGLRGRLDAILRKLPVTDETTALRSEVQADLEAAKDNYTRRRVCARQLVHLRTWEELTEMGLVPPGTPLNPEDPRTYISRAVRHCLQHPELPARLDATIERRLESFSQARGHLERKLADAGGDPKDVLYSKLQFLALRFAYDETKLREAGFLPAEGEDDALTAKDFELTPPPKEEVATS